MTTGTGNPGRSQLARAHDVDRDPVRLPVAVEVRREHPHRLSIASG
jgi:hypothetical protein